MISANQINSVSRREAMDLPNNYTELRFEITTSGCVRHLSTPAKELAQIIEDTGVPLEERYAAGCLLALVGDPRIDVFNPTMIEIPGGSFQMGSSPEQVPEITRTYRDLGMIEDWIEKEVPAFKQDVGAFRIAKYPVTNTEFRAFLLDTGYEFIPDSWPFGRFPAHFSNHPVYTVTPAAADAYVIWLSEKTDRRFRLPTEPEWEYSAGAAVGNEFPWGAEFISDVCNTGETGIFTSTPIGMFPEGNSPFGIADMGGNVEELVADTYRPYPGGVQINDDISNLDPHYRMTRGGGFSRFRDLARCKRRHGFIDLPLYTIGFRVCEDRAPA
ncbi:formylglycine-generating enzyme family protein [Epibacterium ulvae]|uniref:formylglycine-generating enzyme family protein n=1 Tax=Epibacterium ulvae TaxID=1156985 RepID=UPI00248F67D9|nr:SUMF1/EgtB/PvdO family nonheme iron enzyme [Epibacterium ulvae]